MNQENAFVFGDTPDDDARSIVIELEDHDVSRFEWRIAVPLHANEDLKLHRPGEIRASFDLYLKPITIAPTYQDSTPGFRTRQVILVTTLLDHDLHPASDLAAL